MCVACSYNWRGAKKLGPITYGYGRICEDPASWIVWARIWRVYVDWCPATCYWRVELRKVLYPRNICLQLLPLSISFTYERGKR